MADTSEEARFRSAFVRLAEVSTRTTAPTLVRGNVRVGSAIASRAAPKLAAFSSRGKRRAVSRQLYATQSNGATNRDNNQGCTKVTLPPVQARAGVRRFVSPRFVPL